MDRLGSRNNRNCTLITISYKNIKVSNGPLNRTNTLHAGLPLQCYDICDVSAIQGTDLYPGVLLYILGHPVFRLHY